MRRLNQITILLALLFPGVAFGQQEAVLPRVLIIGDSVYRQPASDAKKELQGKADVVYATLPSGEVCDSAAILASLDSLLGEGKWDVIHFNVGLGDLIYRAPGMKSFRVMPIHAGGVRATSPQLYEKNLRDLVTQLKATGAKLIWASTTPIRHSTPNVFQIGSEVEYNAIAAKVMAEHNVPVNDMYTYVKGLIDMEKPAGHGADPFFFDRKPLHPPVVEAMLNELSP